MCVILSPELGPLSFGGFGAPLHSYCILRLPNFTEASTVGRRVGLSGPRIAARECAATVQGLSDLGVSNKTTCFKQHSSYNYIRIIRILMNS